MSVDALLLDGSTRRPRRSIALLATSGASGLLVVGLADCVREHEGLATLDPEIAAEVLHARSPLLTAIAQTFTFAGSELVIGTLAVVCLAVLVLRRHLGRAAVLALGIAGSAGLTVAMKLAVARPRPSAFDRLGPSDSTFSFPSGHTLNSLVFVALMVWLLFPHAGRWRASLVVGAGAVVMGVGASRVYLGYHWATDVLGSALAGTAWLCLIVLAAAPLERLIYRLLDRP